MQRPLDLVDVVDASDFQDLSRAALCHNLVWLPASGDVTAIGPNIPTGAEMAEILRRILDNTDIRNVPELEKESS